MHSIPTFLPLLITCLILTGLFSTEPEPALLLAHADNRFNVDGRRLSILCVAFGSPTPYISWISSNLGSIEATINDTSVNIYTKEFLDRSGDILVLSILEACDSPLFVFFEYTCLASNDITGEVIGVSNFTFAPAPVGMSQYVLQGIMWSCTSALNLCRGKGLSIHCCTCITISTIFYNWKTSAKQMSLWGKPGFLCRSIQHTILKCPVA